MAVCLLPLRCGLSIFLTDFASGRFFRKLRLALSNRVSGLGAVSFPARIRANAYTSSGGAQGHLAPAHESQKLNFGEFRDPALNTASLKIR